MKSFKKYAMLTALFSAAVVQAQTAPAPKPATAAQMQTASQEIKQQIDDDLRHVLHLQALARRGKDVIKLTCINDKLVQIKAQMDLYDNAKLQLDTAISNGDGTAPTVFEDVTKTGNDVKKLRGEADGCAGELELYKQESATNVERPPDLDDPTNGDPGFGGGNDSGGGVEPPGYATPFK